MKRILPVVAAIWLLALVSCSGQKVTVTGKSDPALLEQHLTSITKTEGYRNYANPGLLNKTATYIHRHFSQYADTVYYQEYEAEGQVYKNVIATFGPAKGRVVVVGAHYDVCGNQEGADDNASGVVGLLELARLLHKQPLNYRLQMVAYTLEEPPYFRTQWMGSYIHAKSLAEAKTDVYGMVSLEMIGYFSDEKNSQDYPVAALKAFYGSRGDYITLVKKFGAGKFARRFSNEFKEADAVKTKTFVGPPSLPGIDFSDHLNYWHFGFSALMLTDTAFYRNKNYHQPTDTMQTLDLNRMAGVINGVVQALVNLS